MKQQPMFLESRHEMFRLLFDAEMDDLRAQFRPKGAWTGGATRKRARALARVKARDRMRDYRKERRTEKP